MLQTSMQYRFSFFIELFIEIGYIAWTLAFIYVVFGNITEVGGWNYHEMLVLIGVFTIFSETIMGLFFIWNLRLLPEKIKNGTIDFTLLKPINSQFILTAGNTYISSFFATIPGMFLIWYGISNLEFTFSVVNSIAALIVFICGVIIIYAIMTIISSLAFVLTNAQGLPRLVVDLYQFGQYPPTIYKNIPKFIFTFIFPVVFIAGIPSDIFLHGLNIPNVLLSIVVAIAFLYGSIWVWKQMISHYSSASS